MREGSVTKDHDFKALVRARSARTGESYVEARRQLVEALRSAADGSDRLDVNLTTSSRTFSATRTPHTVVVHVEMADYDNSDVRFMHVERGLAVALKNFTETGEVAEPLEAGELLAARYPTIESMDLDELSDDQRQHLVAFYLWRLGDSYGEPEMRWWSSWR